MPSTESNSRLGTKRGRLLRNYTDKNSCLNYGPETNTTTPYNPSATPDVLDIIIMKDLVTPVYLTMCSALSSDYLHILINTRCRSSFLSKPDCQDLRTEWSKFQACLEARLPTNPDFPNEAAIDACVKELSSAFSKTLADSTPKCRSRDEPRPPIPTCIQEEIA
jgi:hypothetical protein